MSSKAPPPVTVHDEEEDVDDLDEVLNKYPTSTSTQKPSQKSTVPNQPPPPPPAAVPDNSLDDDDFARELAKGMESLMRDISGADPSAVDGSGADDDLTEEQKKAFKAAWEAMLVDGMNGAVDPGLLGSDSKPESSGKSKDTGKEGDFQSSLRQAMDNMRSGESNMKSDALGDESIESLLAQLAKAGEGEGGDDEAELSGFLESMMSQLMSKEILYEPLCELRDKFPSYLTEHSSTLSQEDKTRYEKQLACVRQITAIYEDPSYNDDDSEKGKKVVELMSEMQSHGSPPSEIMGPLPPGMNLGADGMPDGCVIA